MELFRAGVLIKELRKQKGWTQDFLCDGICDKTTLVHIEKERRTPELFTYTSLMERLGEDPHKYYSCRITMDDKRFMDIDEELTDLLRQKNKDAYQKAEVLIEQYECSAELKSTRYFQLLLFHKADLAFKQKKRDVAYTLATEAILLTKPSFTEQTVGLGIYTSAEIELVNLIAAALLDTSTPRDALNVYLQLKIAMDKHYRADKTKQNCYIQMLYNIASIFGRIGEYENCIPICEQGIAISEELRNSHFLSLFLYEMAYSKLHLNEMDEGIHYMSRAFSLFYAAMNYTLMGHIKTLLENKFNLSLYDINPISLYEKRLASHSNC